MDMTYVSRAEASSTSFQGSLLPPLGGIRQTSLPWYLSVVLVPDFPAINSQAMTSIRPQEGARAPISLRRYLIGAFAIETPRE